ncbi:MAG: methenyltetrahydromethanopterin cyclohydrolase [Planctomycetales bacterium]|nr:methenyltetrahydromethanopterin cyclohydrolase [Planctomycetales bacterium]
MLRRNLNVGAHGLFQEIQAASEKLRIETSCLPCGAHVLDFGIRVPGGFAAGLQLARICMAGLADVSCHVGNVHIWPGPWVQVWTDHPFEACMLTQYAGWPVQCGKYFAMGSGPMRLKRGREPLLVKLEISDDSGLAVGTLETDQMPTCEVAEYIAQECRVDVQNVFLAVAPTRSIAGCLQVVARSVETAMHKLHELGFDIHQVVSAHGTAPLPPCTPDLASGIGRTNDAILYGALVTLWLSGDDDQLAELSRQLPSCASGDYGAPFAEIFRRNDFDFYKIDPGLFSPAAIRLINLSSGNSWFFGESRSDLIAKSFGIA